jgi:hypothetical protein
MKSLLEQQSPTPADENRMAQHWKPRRMRRFAFAGVEASPAVFFSWREALDVET